MSAHVETGPHIRMTSQQPPTEADRQRASQIAAEARQALAKYIDYQAALAGGYVIFAPDVPQEVYHFIQWRTALKSMETFDPAQPSALLYRKVKGGYEWVGVMYSAPLQAGEAELDRRYPLSMAQWHAHVNICVPPGALDWNRMASDPEFGFEGSIADRAVCDAAGGHFMPDVFGWMVHVDLFSE